MAFVVTSVSTKTIPDAPDFDVWVDNILDPNIVYSKFPDLEGQNITSIINHDVSTYVDNADQGFVSQESYSNDDNTIWTLITTWENQDTFLTSMSKAHFSFRAQQPISGTATAVNTSPIFTGNGTLFTTELSIGSNVGTVSGITGHWRPAGTVASIESDTSLTLTSNSLINTYDRPVFLNTLDKDDEITVLAFIQNLYNETYPVTVEITYANV